MATKSELLSFLDKHVFHPILNVKGNKFDTKQREDLEDLKTRTESEKARFHGYDSLSGSSRCIRTISPRKTRSRSMRACRILVCLD